MDQTPATELPPGLGTIGFNTDGSCFGTIRRNGVDITVRGDYTGTNISLAGDNVAVALAPVARRTERGPRARGSIVFTDTGEVKKACMWAPKNKDAIAYGLSEDVPFVPGENVHMPF